MPDGVSAAAGDPPSEGARAAPFSVDAFFDGATNTVTYLVADAATRRAAIIDSVLDLDYAAGRIATISADRVIERAQAHGLTVDWVLETHAHADHLSAAPYLQEKLGGKLGVGAQITLVQEVFGKIFNEGTEFERDGSQFDMLFEDGATFSIGDQPVRVLHTPGHTPACLTYVVGEPETGRAAFVGDTLFMPDFGTARCDFPGGSSATLFASIQKILALPDETRIFVGHDYKAPGRDVFAWESTVGEQKARNIHIGGGAPEADFVSMRDARDATLSAPRLIIPSLQVNIRAGHLPAPDADGDVVLKVPLNKL